MNSDEIDGTTAADKVRFYRTWFTEVPACEAPHVAYEWAAFHHGGRHYALTGSGTERPNLRMRIFCWVTGGYVRRVKLPRPRPGVENP